MKTLAVFMMIILAINVTYAVDVSVEDRLGMLEGAAAVDATNCVSRFSGEQEDAPTIVIEQTSETLSI